MYRAIMELPPATRVISVIALGAQPPEYARTQLFFTIP